MLCHYQEAFIRLFYPAECALCRKMLTLEESLLCAHCQEELSALAWSFEEAFVDERFEYLDHVWTVFAYGSPLKKLLHGVKYSRRDYLFKACEKPAISLAQAITSDFWYDALIPIPIDRLRRVKRHFNQTECLADRLAPWLIPKIEKSLLGKRYPIPSQTFLNRQERAVNIYGVFKVRRPKRVPGRSFLLIDDVFTTGATANEAARVLKLHGAKRVDLLALSRTVPIPNKNSLRFHTHTDKIVAS